MPRAKLRSKVLSAPDRSKAIIASAANLTKPTIPGARPGLPTTGSTSQSVSTIGGDTSWQADCWTYYDSIGEYRYSVNWVGNLLSKAVLQITENGEPSDDKDATLLMEQLFDGPEGQADMLRLFGIHYTVAGDCYLFGVNAGDDAKDDWLVAAANQTTRAQDGVWTVANEKFTGLTPLVIRLWQPHPQNRLNSDSPSHAALTVLSELDGLTKKVAADIDSRLSGAGMLLIPNEISFGAPTPMVDPDSGEDAAEPVSQPDELIRALMEVSAISLSDQSSAAAKVPLVLQGPGENLNQIKHLVLSTPLDEQAQALRTEAIRRLALSMDMPPEILTGTSDMNHWSSWQLEEAAIKAHTEPLLAAICSALTEGYLRPLLSDQTKAPTFAIVADTSALRLRPNRSAEAIELNDRGVLNDAAMLRENGFDPADATTPEQLAQWLLKKTAQGTALPNVVEAALRALQVPLGTVPQDPTTIREQVGGTPVDPTQQGPALDAHPTQAPPDPTQTEAAGAAGKAPAASAPVTASGEQVEEAEAALTAAAGVMVYRALERAGNKIKAQMGGTVPGVAAADLYRHVALDFGRVNMDKLLDDAWSTADKFAPQFQVDRKWLSKTLDSYTRELIRSRRAFDYQTLRAHLKYNAPADPSQVIDRG